MSDTDDKAAAEAVREDAEAFNREIDEYLAKLPPRFKREDGRTVDHEDEA